MAVPLNAATAAYYTAAKLISEAGRPSLDASGVPGQGVDFGKLLTDSLQSVMDSGKKSDALSVDLVNGKANVVDVVTAISQTEIAMESMVAIRDKVISAYEEIMRMPI